MLNFNFLKKWDNINSFEKDAIETLKKTSNMLFELIPTEEVISLYIKGSLVRRELNKDSDIDLVVVLKTRKYVSIINKFTKEYEFKFPTRFECSVHTLWELKTGKKLKIQKSGTPINRFMKHVNNFILLFGKDISNMKCFMPNDKRYLKNRIIFVKNQMLAGYENKKVDAKTLVKQVLWLVESEQYAKDKNPPHGFHKLANSISNKEHIVHETLKLRNNLNKYDKLTSEYIKKLKVYMKDLEDSTDI